MDVNCDGEIGKRYDRGVTHENQNSRFKNGRRAHFGGSINQRSGRLARVGGVKLAAQ